MSEPDAKRPVILALAGSNGAGKSTFYRSFLANSGLRFLNADNLARELNIDAYKAADLVNVYRQKLVDDAESFIFETVLSDTVGDKINFLRQAAKTGYDVTLVFIGLDSPESSIQRVGMRVAQGGHDVPEEKLQDRFERTLANLALALASLPKVVVFDNSDLRTPYEKLAAYHDGRAIFAAETLPKWFQRVLRKNKKLKPR